MSEAEAAAKRRSEAGSKVRLRELSRARQALTSAGLAPGNDETLAELENRKLRPGNHSEPLPAAAMSYVLGRPLELKDAALQEALRGAGRGSAAGLSGSRMKFPFADSAPVDGNNTGLGKK